MASSFSTLTRTDRWMSLRPELPGALATAVALPVPVGRPTLRLPTPPSIAVRRVRRRGLVLAASFVAVLALAAPVTLAATRLASHVRWEPGPALPQRYAELADGTLIGIGSGMTGNIEVESETYELKYRVWNDDGCRFQATLLLADAAPVPVLDVLVGGRRSGTLPVGRVAGGTARIDVESSCLWSLRLVPVRPEVTGRG
jgi:hypothetical protein